MLIRCATGRKSTTLTKLHPLCSLTPTRFKGHGPSLSAPFDQRVAQFRGDEVSFCSKIRRPCEKRHRQSEPNAPEKADSPKIRWRTGHGTNAELQDATLTRACPSITLNSFQKWLHAVGF